MRHPKHITINGLPYTKIGLSHTCDDGEVRPIYRDDATPRGSMGTTACPNCTRHNRTGAENEAHLIEMEKVVLAALTK